MTIPTGLGLTRGVESADLPGTPLGNRQARAAANDARYGGMSMSPDPCYCGCCKLNEGCC
jgi:hypothetical protein